MTKYINNSIENLEAPCVVRFADKQEHFRHALVCKLGRKYAQLIWIDSSVRGHGIRVHRVLLQWSTTHQPILRYSRPIGEVYPPKKAAREILKASKILGITKGAKKLLKEILNYNQSVTLHYSEGTMKYV